MLNELFPFTDGSLSKRIPRATSRRRALVYDSGWSRRRPRVRNLDHRRWVCQHIAPTACPGICRAGCGLLLLGGTAPAFVDCDSPFTGGPHFHLPFGFRGRIDPPWATTEGWQGLLASKEQLMEGGMARFITAPCCLKYSFGGLSCTLVASRATMILPPSLDASFRMTPLLELPMQWRTFSCAGLCGAV